MLIILGSFLLLPLEIAFAGDGDVLRAYDTGRLSEVLNLYQSGELDQDQVDFLRAAMTADADSAVEIYRRIVLRDPESEIAKRALERIRQYYYAQGLYSRAGEIGKTLCEWKIPPRHLRTPETTPPPPFLLSSEMLSRPPERKQPQSTPEKPEPEPEKPSPQAAFSEFCLQVGAFSSPANAESFEERFEKAGYNAVIEPPREGSRLYLVKITGYSTLDEAFTAAEKIERDFGIKPIIVPGTPD
jgi:cell division septation protein DedD